MEHEELPLVLTPVNETIHIEDENKSCTHNFSDDEEDPELVECKKCSTSSNFSEGRCKNCGESFLKDNKTGYFLGDGFIDPDPSESEEEEVIVSDADSCAHEKEMSDYETSDGEYSEEEEDNICYSDDEEEWLPPNKKRVKVN